MGQAKELNSTKGKQLVYHDKSLDIFSFCFLKMREQN
jgi:hypothetical protein